jgi:hypothetical protein
MRLTVKSGSVCTFDGPVSFTSQFPENVFVIGRLSLVIEKVTVGSTVEQTRNPVFRFSNNATIEYYDTVTFLGIDFDGDVGLKNTNIFGFLFVNPLWPLKLTIKNSLIGGNIAKLTEDQQKKDVFKAFMMFNIEDAYSLNLENVEIVDMYISDFSPFQILFTPSYIDKYIDVFSLSISNFTLNRA